MQKFFETRSQAREFAKTVDGKVKDTEEYGCRWMVEYQGDERDTLTENLAISVSDGQSIHDIVELSKAAFAGTINTPPVVNRDNSRALVSRNKREGKYRDRLWNNFAKSVECALKAVKETGCTLREGFAKERS